MLLFLSSQCSFLVIPVLLSCHPSAQTLGSRKKNDVMQVADTGSFMTVSSE
ncbi:MULTISPECIES: hypothetical protein [unclassified Wolbachia]|uniref:hypothetical protein n=1 Tax=unclassified Wolbachia TaxID=2640676 RepID=UPI0022325422|nr:hypothetical protein [Wolbachia endosymbiont (group A) of Apoderus coryli]